MAQAINGEVTLEWDERGDPDGETILLIMGLAAQMTAWRDGFCDLLVDHGFRVIRFDNRDAGLSTRTEGVPPTIADLARLIMAPPRRRRAAYTLSDMAADATAVLDAAGVDRAHVVGASLGGMIAQTVAIEHPARTASLTSIMSRTGSRLSGLPTPRVLAGVSAKPPTEPEAALEYELRRSEMISGPLFDRDAMRDFLSSNAQRARSGHGQAFQLAAMFASGDRTRALRSLDVPTLVIHGRVDPLVNRSGGEATARAIPGAQLVVHHQMGHDLPRAMWPVLTDAIAGHANRAVRHRRIFST